jgi:hypothetical protein
MIGNGERNFYIGGSALPPYISAPLPYTNRDINLFGLFNRINLFIRFLIISMSYQYSNAQSGIRIALRDSNCMPIRAEIRGPSGTGKEKINVCSYGG